MPASVPNFNFLAGLVSEIWGWSQNKKLLAPDLPRRPGADKFLYRALVRVNDYNCAKFQLPSSISYICFKTHQRFTLHSGYTHAKVGKEKCVRTAGSVGVTFLGTALLPPPLMGEHCKLHQRGLGPQPKSNLVHFGHKIWHSGWPLVWKTWKCQGIWQLSAKCQDFTKSQGIVREKILWWKIA